jgi:hypothetical protein
VVLVVCLFVCFLGWRLAIGCLVLRCWLAVGNGPLPSNLTWRYGAGYGTGMSR